MIFPSLDQFKLLAKKGNLVPVYEEIPADLDTPVSAFLKIRTGDHDFLLESAVRGEKWGRFSFLGTKPAAVFRSRGKEGEIIRGKSREHFSVEKDSLEVLENFLSEYIPADVSGLPRFFGGAIGFLSYDMVRHFEDIPQNTGDELKLHDAYFAIADTVLVFDNYRQVIKVVANVRTDDFDSIKSAYEGGVQKIGDLIKRLKKSLPKEKKFRRKKILLKPAHTEKEFCCLVKKVQDYIKAGDVFQTVISTRFEGKVDLEPFELYRSIRSINPSPYLYYLNFDDMAVVGASPEVMVRLENGTVELRPIAGTRRRGKDSKEEALMEAELVSDPKERAEHIMLVDLGRNDVGRVCKPGSVRVDEMEVVERYSHVMHLVSHISGRLKKGCTAFDLIRSAFPAGTLTGAPKIRAMEIIEELEGKRRGIYGGCVGYIGFTGNMDTAITIRTALFKNGRIYIQAGAGIVNNSVPRLEYKECRNKAEGMLKALESVGDCP